MHTKLLSLLFTSMIAIAPLPGAAIERLNVCMPGADQKIEGGTWYALTIDGKDLVLEPVKSRRNSEWTTTSTVKAETRTGTGSALDLPSAALFAIQDAGGSIVQGHFASVIDAPVTLRTGMAVPLGGKWTLSTEYRKRPDGEMLAGSMSLLATSADGQRQVILPPTSGMAYARQELLWLGHAKQGGWDAVVRRTRLTGETEYVVRIGDAIAFGVDDGDRPTLKFSSGIGESKSESRNQAQKHEAPAGKFGIAAFSFPQEAWNAALEKARTGSKPANLLDRKLMVVSDEARFTADYLPRWQAKGDEPQSGGDEMWRGPVVLRVHYRGASQPLLELGELEGSPLKVQAGTIDGMPAIEVSYLPDSNNVLTYHWIWNEELKRFQRLARNQEQGC